MGKNTLFLKGHSIYGQLGEGKSIVIWVIYDLSCFQSFPNVVGLTLLTGKILVGPLNYDLFLDQMFDGFVIYIF